MLRIGELAERAGMSHRTLRYYERMGLLQPAQRAESGHRYYEEGALERLRRIQQLKALDLPLEDIAEVLDAYFQAPPDRSGKAAALVRLQAHLSATRARLETLRTLEQVAVTAVTRMEILLHG
jgi:MerR family transcriptional regulator, copper efflux regulator